jgi:hypothetical protein
MFYIIILQTMTKSKAIIFTTAWALGIASLFLMGSSTANFGWFGQGWEKNQITESTTYSEFLESIEGTKRAENMTEEQFNEIKERRVEREQNREAVETAIQNHDYAAWTELHEGMDILENIDTEEKFEKLIEMHGIMEDARTYMDWAREKADAIAEELGLERWQMGQRLWEWMGEKMGMKKWMRNRIMK